jgi:hypothetical protein
MLSGDRLEVYLQDHLAGATGGVELARRIASQNEGTAYGDVMARLAGEIDEDREELKAIMARVGAGADRLKIAGAWAGEKAGRLKRNGTWLEYSPTSRLIELEGLSAGVTGKLRLWTALREIAPGRPDLDAANLDNLIARATRQLDTLAEQHRRAAAEAF